MSMTCYFRHIKDVFDDAGIRVTSDNKKQIDRAIHNLVDVEYKNCPEAWVEIKRRIAEDRETFISELKRQLKILQKRNT